MTVTVTTEPEGYGLLVGFRSIESEPLVTSVKALVSFGAYPGGK